MKAFLSYRSDDSDGFTESLHTFLTAELRIESFKGGGSIRAGHRWFPDLMYQIASSDVFVPVIGPNWEAVGNRDIRDAEDIVRLEIEQAIKKNIRIVPLLLDRPELNREKLPPHLYEALTAGQYKFATAPFPKEGLPSFIVELRQIAEEIRPKPVVLLSSTLAFLGNKDSTEGLDYFMTLVMSIIQVLKAHHREVIPKIPPYAGSNAIVTVAENQREMLHQIVEDLSHYSGLIIAPFETGSLRDELMRLLHRDSSFPVATIDKVYPRDDQHFAAAGYKPPAGAAGNSFKNGGLAAKSIIDYFVKAEISHPNVVVLQGLEGSRERIQGFIEKVNEHNSDPQGFGIHLSISREMEFLDKKASETAQSYMDPKKDWASLNDPQYMAMIRNNAKRVHESVDAFFCCNDEMAIGVCEIFEGIRNKSGVVVPTVVVGYDGIAAVRRRISNRDSWLLNSVDVRMGMQVHRLVEEFNRALQNRTQVSDIEPVEGIMVSSDQSGHIAEIMLQRRGGGLQLSPPLSPGLTRPAAT